MATIVTRAGKGSPLTNTDMDNNLTNLNAATTTSGGTAAELAGAASQPFACSTLAASGNVTISGGNSLKGSYGGGGVNSNVVIGDSVFPNSGNTGGGNTAIGYQALYGSSFAISGTGNTAIGNQALLSNQTGSQNTAVGQWAGKGNSDNSTCIFIGYNANTSAGLTNNIVIGAGATGTASNQVVLGHTSITSTVLQGAVTVSNGLAVTGTVSATTTGKVGTTLGVGNTTPATTGAGITFPATQSASSDLNTLDDYAEYTSSSVACTGAITTAAIWKAVKVGKVVTLTLPSVVGVATATTYITFGEALPVSFRPAATLAVACVLVIDNAQYQAGAGLVFIDTSGVIRIYRDGTQVLAYTAAANAGIGFAISLSWVV